MREPALPFSVDFRFSRKRRTVSLEVREGRVRVLAPHRIDRQWLAGFVASRQAWIEDKLARQQAQLSRRPQCGYTTGERLPFLDGELTLSVTEGARAGVAHRGDSLMVTLSRRSNRSPAEQTQGLVRRWYRDTARQLLADKTHALCRRAGLSCRQVAVRATRSKWGHCTRDGRIQYNWQILLAPERVVDYLVAHEVCHLRHPHHGRAFWREVARWHPTVESDRRWLRDEGYRLTLPTL